jgi:hypothetical protein
MVHISTKFIITQNAKLLTVQAHGTHIYQVHHYTKCKASDCSSTWYKYLPSSSLHNILLTFLICSTNCADLMIGCSAQYLDKSALIGTNSTYSIMQFFGIELWKWCHHGNNQVFKATTQFTLQVRY